MGEIVLSSELSGRKFGFTIAGEEPTIDEQMRIDNILRQQDAQFIGEYKEQFGTSPTDEGEGIANYAGEVFKGIGRGAVGFLEQAALGAATGLDEEQELAAREAIRSTAYDFKPQTDIGMEDTVGGKFGEALGSFAPLLASRFIPGVGIVAPYGLGSLAGAGQASERARGADATLEERNKAIRQGLLVGASEGLPLSFGKLTKMLDGSGVLKRAGRVAEQAGLEGLQELAASIAQNLIEQGYNPDQEFGEGGLESFGYGAGVGGFVQLVADLITPGRGRRVPPPEPREDEKKAVENAVKNVDENQKQVETTQEEFKLTAEDPYSDLVDDESEFSEAAAFEAAEAEAAKLVDAREDAIQSIIREVQDQDGAFLSREEAINILEQRGLGDARGDRITPGGDGASLQGDQLGVDGEGGDGSGDQDSPDARSSDGTRVDTIESDFKPSNMAAGKQPNTLGFTTARGSTYTVDKGGKTTRTRAPRKEGEGFEPQPQSGKTIYSSYEDMLKFGSLFQKGELGLYTFEPVENRAGVAQLVYTRDYGENKAGDAVSGTEISYSTAPEVGLHPIEIYKSTNIYGDEIHFGTEITSLDRQAEGQGELDFNDAVDERAILDQQEINDAKAAARAQEKQIEVERGSGFSGSEKTYIRDFIDTDPELAPLFKKSTSKKVKRKLLGIRASKIRDMLGMGGLDGVRTRPNIPITGIEGVDRQQSQDAELDTRTPESTATPAIPTMEVLEELGISKGVGAYQVAKNSLADSIANNDKDSERADVARIFEKLIEYSKSIKEKNKKLSTRIDKYVAKYAPKESTPEAKAQRDATRKQRRSAISKEEARQAKNEAAQEARETKSEDRAIEEVATQSRLNQAVSIPEGMNVTPESNRTEELQRFLRNKPQASLNQKSKLGLDDVKTRRVAFSDFVLKNVRIATPEGGTRKVASVEELSPKQLEQAIEEFDKKEVEELTAQIFSGKRTKEKNAKRARMRRTKFEAYLKDDMQYSAEEISQLRRAANKKELDEIYNGFVEGEKAQAELLRGFDPNYSRLEAEATIGLNLPLDPVTMTMLEDNNLTDALRNYAKSAPNPSIAKMAKALSRLVGTTRVMFANVPGGRVSGAFDPQTNTIVLNENVEVVGHTLMHEMMHAATINEMTNNPNKPAVRQLQKIFDEISDALPSAYGSRSTSEFIAEAFSNPEFQKQLAAIRLTGAKGSLLDQVRRQIARVLNFIKGKPNISALAEVEAIVDGLLAPAPAYVNADIMYNIANDPIDARNATNAALMNGPIFDAREGNKMLAWLEDKTRGGTSSGYNLGKTIALRATPLHYLVDLGKKFFSPTLMDSINNTMNKASGRLQENYDRTEAIVGDMVRWANAHPDQVETFNSLVNESTTYQVDPEISEAQALREYEGKTELMDIYNRLRGLYKDVGNEGRKQYRQTRNLFRSMRSELQDAIRSRLSQVGIPESVQNNMLRDFYARLSSRGTIEPYFPLTREGNIWLFFTGVDPVTKNLEYYAESFESEAQRNRAWSEIKGEVIGNMLNSEKGQERIETLRNNPNVNTDGLSKERIAEMAAGVTATVSVPKEWYGGAPEGSFLNDLMTRLGQAASTQGEEASKAQEQAIEAVSELILNTLPETSYVQSFRRRREGNIAKAALSTRQDAIKTISTRAKSLTRQIVEMEYNAEFNRLNSKLREELKDRSGKDVGVSSTEAAMYKELDWFTRNGVKQKHTSMSRALTGVAFNFTLGFNVSGGLINLSQIPLIVLPMLGGKYGYAKTMKAMKYATKTMFSSGFSRKIEGVSDQVDADGNPIMEEKTIKSALSMANIDFTDPNLSDDLKELKELAETGIDLGQFKRSLDYEILDIDRMSGFWAKFNKASGFFLHHGERVNREVTMIASYKLALDKMSAAERADPMMRREAAAEAVKDAESMNGGLAANATPRLAQNDLGRVIFMYKKYGVTMLSLLHKLSREALAGQSPQAKRMAMFQLAGIYGSAGALAGVAGMPLYGTVSMLHDLFADDDDVEGDDLDSIVRMYLGEGPYRGGVNYLTGINVATRVGLGEFLFRDTLVKSDMPLLYQYIETLGGPLVGVYLNTERAAKLMGQGEFYRAFEAAAPAAIKNGMKSLRYYNDEGIENVAGDKIIGDIHPAHVAVQAFGFSPAAYSRTLELNADAKGAERAVITRRSKLLRKYFKAYFDGDQDQLNKIAQRMQEYNQDHPQYPITTDTITRSRKKRLSDKEKKYRGITYNARLRDRYVGYLEDYGDDVSMLF